MRASSFRSLPELLVLRSGKQAIQDTATSDEITSLDAGGSVIMQCRYGTNDEGASRESDGAPMEMTQPPTTIDTESAGATLSNVPTAASSPLLASVAPVTVLLRVAGTLYSTQLMRRPVLTKSLTAGIIFGLSDWCAQLIERDGSSPEGGQGQEPIVFSRILASSLVGLLVFGPAANAWYAAIFEFLPSKSLLSTMKKAALGQLLFGPAFTCVFFGAGMIQSGSFSPGAWLRKIRTDLPAVWASGIGFWPFVDLVSYKVVPEQWIPLFVNFCSFLWTIYLSLVANRGDG